MHDAFGVCRREPLENWVDDREGLIDRKASALVQNVAQGVARHVLHGQEDGAIVLSLVEHLDDVRVGQPGGGPRLAGEAGDEVRVFGERGVHHLERDRAVESGVGGPVDRGHAPARNPLVDEVSLVDEAPDQRVGTVRVHNARVYVRDCGG